MWHLMQNVSHKINVEVWTRHILIDKGSVTTRWLGGRRPFEVDSFHAAPIGIMLKI